MSLKSRGLVVAKTTVGPVALWIIFSGLGAGCSTKFDDCHESRTCGGPLAGAGGQAGGAVTATAGGATSGSGGAGRGGSATSGGADTAPEAGAGGEAGGNQMDPPVENAGGHAGHSGHPLPSGQAGEGGEPGSAGSDSSEPECASDADCDDRLFCNGREKCVAGACRSGAPPCENPDADHCTVSCEEGTAAASCIVQGTDADADGYLSAACQAAPGNDCDDARDDVHPGAQERCDGVDHDCNGHIGIDDGLPVSGSSEQLGDLGHAERTSPAITWSDVSSAYGVVWIDRDATDGAVQFAEMNQAGEIVSSAKGLGGSAAAANWPDIAWGTDSFGVAWAESGGSAYGVYFERLNAAGAPLAVPESWDSPGMWPRVARVDTNPWILQWTACGRGCYRNVIAITPGEPGASIGGGSIGLDLPMGIAAGASALVVTYDQVAAELRDGQYNLLQSLDTGGMPVIAGSGPSGFAIVTQPASGRPQVTLLDQAGQTVCGPKDIGDSDFVPSAVAGSEDGFIVVSSGKLRGQVISTSCDAGPIFEIDPGSADDSRVAVGADGYAVVWSDSATGVPRRRLFGSRICD